MPLAFQSLAIMIDGSTRSKPTMKILPISYLTEFRWRMAWFTFRNILNLLHHQVELTSLVTWTKRKRLKNPQRTYEFRLHQIEEQLFRQRRENRSLLVFCEFLYAGYQQLCPPVYRKGHAAKYKNISY